MLRICQALYRIFSSWSVRITQSDSGIATHKSDHPSSNWSSSKNVCSSLLTLPSKTLKIFSDNLNSQEPSIYEAPSTYFIGGGNWIHWMVQLGYPMNRKEYLLGKRKIRGREIKMDMGIMDILKQGIKHLEIWKK